MGLTKRLRRILRRHEAEGYTRQQVVDEIHNAYVLTKEQHGAIGVPRKHRRWLKRRIEAFSRLLKERER